jgi:AcrR family transcriptional regulator
VFYTGAVTPSTPRPAPDDAALPPPPRHGPHREPPRRRTALTAEAIVQAALAVLDASGVAGLSMRRVAEQLGTGASSLYAHVSGKEELLELVFDELVGQVPLPEPDAEHWREQVIAMMTGLRDVLVGHRDAALAGLGRVPTTPNTLAASEVLVTAMRLGGLADRVIGLALDQLTLYVSASAFEASIYGDAFTSDDDRRRYFDEVHRYYEALPPDRFPVMTSLIEDITGFDGEDRFRFGLEVFLAGFEAMSRRDQP